MNSNNKQTSRKTAFAAALLAALSMTYASTSSADSHNDRWHQDSSYHDNGHNNGHDNDRNNNGRPDWQDRNNHPWPENDHRDGRYDHHYDDHRRYKTVRYVYPRGYQERRWVRGETLPRNYRDTRYVVYDYRNYGLYAPPRDHRWVRVNNDVLLVQVSNGYVNASINGLFY